MTKKHTEPEQATIPAAGLEHVTEWKGWQIYRCSDGSHEAYRSVGTEQKIKVGENGLKKIAKGMKRIVLPGTTTLDAIEQLRRATSPQRRKTSGPDPDQMRIDLDDATDEPKATDADRPEDHL